MLHFFAPDRNFYTYIDEEKTENKESGLADNKEFIAVTANIAFTFSEPRSPFVAYLVQVFTHPLLELITPPPNGNHLPS